MKHPRTSKGTKLWYLKINTIKEKKNCYQLSPKCSHHTCLGFGVRRSEWSKSLVLISNFIVYTLYSMFSNLKATT